MWYIFRHGETLYNKNKITQGRNLDSFLTLNGAIQTHMNGVKLLNLEKDTDFHNYKFICSPLERTNHTCQLIIESLGINDITPIQEKLIISKGKSTILKDKNNKIIEHQNIWMNNENNTETYRDIYIRLATFVEKYRNEKNIVIVAHKGVNRNLMYLIEKSKEIENLVEWVKSFSEDYGNELVYNLKLKVPDFEQCYFYSWDGNKFIKY